MVGAGESYHFHLMIGEGVKWPTSMCMSELREFCQLDLVLHSVKQSRGVKYKCFAISCFPCKIKFIHLGSEQKHVWLHNSTNFPIVCCIDVNSY